MIKKLGLGLALASAATLAQAEADYNWYIDPMIFYSITDSSYPDSIDDGAGGRIIFGRNLTNNLAAELGFVGDQLSNDGGDDINRAGATLDLRYGFGDSNVQPFILGGLGMLNIDSDSAGLDENELVINAGLGLLWKFHRSGAAFRTEARAKSFDLNDESYVDYDIGVGVHIPLGGHEAAAPVVAPIAVPQPAVLDSDRDGVLDTQDKCPGTPVGTRVDDNGCPVADIITLRGLNFARNSAALTLAGSELEQALRVMQKYPDMRILIAGHTDSRASDAYNLDLSRRRAASVKGWLMDRGIASSRMEVSGFGESRPIATNDTPEGRARNRRVELHVLR